MKNENFMGKIKILEDRVIDKIAAGEIVERPASVVKELIENSIDAKASSIEVEVMNGGKDVIKVKDNGEGMERDDLILAFERHATSKIVREADLFSISTMGFRGEAVPSISSVSIMAVRSGVGFEKPAHEIHAKGGKIMKIEEVQPCKGTTVEVNSIFFNIPVRKKFLKNTQTELSRIIECVQNYALFFSGHRFVLKTEKKELLNLPPVAIRIDRIAQLFGAVFSKNLVPFVSSDEPFSIEGFISKVPEGLKNRSGQHFFINGRFIKDRVLASATLNAYSSYFQEKHPYIFLFLGLDPSFVDFNVHPAKMEVRFRNQHDVYRKVQEIILSTLSKVVVTSPEYALSTDQGRAHRISEKALSESIPLSVEPLTGAQLRTMVVVPQPTPFPRDWRIIGQHLDTYIVASHGNELYIIDQHIAHERVLYEDFIESARNGKIEKQKLLFPITIDLSFSEASWIEANKDLILKAGISAESFGEGTIKIEEIPAHLRIDSAIELVKEIAFSHESLERNKGDDELSSLLSSLACHSAVKAGERLPVAKMEFIVESLFQCSNPHFCPHGRPIFMRLESSDFTKHFKRRS